MENKYRFGDLLFPVAVAIKDAKDSPYDKFVGLEHYDSLEPVISRYTDTNLLSSSVKEFHAGDMLIARRNVYLRRAGLAIFDGLTSGDSIVLRLKGEDETPKGIDRSILSRILPFVLNSDNFWIYANKHADGMNSKRISIDNLLNYEFDLPSLEKQKALADKLWAAYEVKQSYLRMIEATEKMVKSQFVEMFGTIDNPMWDPRFLPDLSKNLDSKRIPIKSDNRKHGIYPYYGASGIVDYVADYLFDEDILLVSEDGANLKDRVTPIAFSSSGKVWVNNHAHVLSFNDLSLQKYVEHFLNYNKIEKFLTGTAQPKLNQDKLNEIPIPFPHRECLLKFDNLVNQVDKSEIELKKSIEAIDKVIKSLINENL